MAPKPRIHYPGALHHVISKGDHRQDIFLGDVDRTAYLRKGAHVRGTVAYLPRALAGHTVKDIAEHFLRSPMEIS